MNYQQLTPEKIEEALDQVTDNDLGVKEIAPGHLREELEQMKSRSRKADEDFKKDLGQRFVEHTSKEEAIENVSASMTGTPITPEMYAELEKMAAVKAQEFKQVKPKSKYGTRYTPSPKRHRRKK